MFSPFCMYYNLKPTCMCTGQNQFVKVLESFFATKRVHEEGDVRDRLTKILEPLCPICECSTSDVVDCLSFVTRILHRAVFDFFGSQVRKPTIQNRLKKGKRTMRIRSVCVVCDCLLCQTCALYVTAGKNVLHQWCSTVESAQRSRTKKRNKQANDCRSQ